MTDDIRSEKQDFSLGNFSNHYYCTVYGARLMAPRKQGLIVVVSSIGGLRYLFNVAYGVGKAAVSVIPCRYFQSKINV